MTDDPKPRRPVLLHVSFSFIGWATLFDRKEFDRPKTKDTGLASDPPKNEDNALTMHMGPFGRLPTFADGGEVMVVIETPKGSRNKYAYDERLGVFELKGVLPEGNSFPYDYGYVPATKGGDGDPLDILVLMDAEAFPGCVIKVRVVGAIEAEQTERDGRRERNDRLIGVATHAHTHGHVTALSDLRPQMVSEIEAFFEHYNRLAGKEFRPVSRSDAEEAMNLIQQAVKDYVAA